MPEPILDMLSRAASLLSPENLTAPGAMLWGLLLYLLCLPFLFRRMGLIRNVCIAALFLYTAAVLQVTQCLTLPASLSWDQPSASLALDSVEWNPMRSLSLKSFGAGLGESFLILMPVGILAPLAGSGFRPGKMLILSVVCGAGLEALQLLSNILTRSTVRSVRTQDAVLGAAGCLLAYLALAGVKKLAESKHPARHYARSGS